jgi:zinc D-Ala-D-Ala carboxypeptidase
MTEMLSPHFTLTEFTTSQTASREGIDNSPSPEHHENLKKIAAVMELVRSLLGDRPINVSSGYRSPALNAAVGGASSSAHCAGLACDFQCDGFGTPHEIAVFLSSHVGELGIDQLINEYPPNGWVHVGLSSNPPRNQVATIDGGGFRLGLV